MKKYLILIVSILMFTNFTESQAQCTYPWQHMVEVVTVDGCDYQVDLCVWCRYSYPGEVRVNSYRNIGSCSTTLNPAQITQQIYTQLMSTYSLWYNICASNLPPCKNSPPLVFNLQTPLCWKIQLIYIDIDPKKNIYVGIPCDDDAYCYSEHQYCIDKYGVKHHTVGGYLGYNFPPDCAETEGYEIKIPTVLNEESDCYILHTVCNP